MSKFKLGDKVKKKNGTTVYIVTGIYLKEYNKGNASGCEYRLTDVTELCKRPPPMHNSYSCENDLVLVREFKAYAYENKNGICWFSSEKKRSGYVRVVDFDFIKEC